MKRFSQMNRDELQKLIQELQHEKQKLKKEKEQSQLDVINQRILLARSYLIDPKVIQTKQIYDVKEERRPFYLAYLKGIMAWGHWIGSKELTAIPIARLKKISDLQID